LPNPPCPGFLPGLQNRVSPVVLEFLEF
jgi:hypothetical protein